MDILSSPSKRPTRAHRPVGVAGALCAAFLLAGCGNKGPLIPPQPPAPKTSAFEAPDTRSAPQPRWLAAGGIHA